MSDQNPYAPPEAGPNEARPRRRAKSRTSVDAQEALARLIQHLEDPSNVEADRAAVGGRLRTVTIAFCVIAGLSLPVLAILAAKAMDESSQFMAFARRDLDRTVTMVGIGFCAVFLILAIVLIAVDLTIVKRDTPASPEATAKSFLKAMALGRQGYAWACLSPTAREETVLTPSLHPVPTGAGTFKLETPENVKAYALTFLRPGQGQLRTLQIKRTQVVEEKGDVAVVEIDATLQAWPQWASIVGAAGIAAFRVIGTVVWLVLYLALRKSRPLQFKKTLLRGQNGLWYMYSGDPFDGAFEPKEA